MTAADPRSVATRFFKAWTTGDFDTARLLLHDDVSFRGLIDSFTDAGYYLILLARLTKDLLRLTILASHWAPAARLRADLSRLESAGCAPVLTRRR